MSRWAKPGADGTALVHDMLISAMTTKQIAESRGMVEQEWERYFTKSLGECPGGMSQLLGRRLRIFQRIANAALEIAG